MVSANISRDDLFEGDLQERQFAFAGRLAAMTREQAAELVRAHGGSVTDGVTKRTEFLVLGQDGIPLEADGNLPRNLRRARELQGTGSGPEILTEEEFYGRLGLGEHQQDVHRLYTIFQLSRILKLPGRQIRAWVRAGLIEPARVKHRLMYFDFQQVAAAKSLSDLARSGVSPSRIRRSLGHIRSWLPSAEVSLAQLGILEEHGTLLVRLEDGRLAEPSGQLHLDFEEDEDVVEAAVTSPPAIAGAPPPRTQEDWFEAATILEERGRLEQASQAYEKALETGPPRAEISFNHGNVLYSLGRQQEAAQRFLQAIEVDPDYVEAWNNLGNALSDLSRPLEALRSFRQALEIAPSYAEAHYNLAETLHQIGKTDGAKKHWQAYLKLDPHSPWAREVQARLEEVLRRPPKR